MYIVEYSENVRRLITENILRIYLTEFSQNIPHVRKQNILRMLQLEHSRNVHKKDIPKRYSQNTPRNMIKILLEYS